TWARRDGLGGDHRATDRISDELPEFSASLPILQVFVRLRQSCHLAIAGCLRRSGVCGEFGDARVGTERPSPDRALPPHCASGLLHAAFPALAARDRSCLAGRADYTIEYGRTLSVRAANIRCSARCLRKSRLFHPLPAPCALP